MKSIKIFDLELPRYTFGDLGVWTREALLSDKQLMVAKAPSEFLLRAKHDPTFKDVLVKADLLVADGIGVLWAAKYLSLRSHNAIICIWQMIYSGAMLVFNHNYAKDVLPERLSGIEVLYTMLSACQEAGKSVYVFGARPEVLKKSLEIISTKYPTLNLAGSHDGYSDKGQEVVDDINKCKPTLLIVALGSPEQEYWVRDNLHKLDTVRVAVGEGGSFDAIAGVTKRAPRFIQNIGLEWLWRGLFAKNLTGNGHRIRRIWNAVPVFVYEVVKWKIKYGPNEAK